MYCNYICMFHVFNAHHEFVKITNLYLLINTNVKDVPPAQRYIRGVLVVGHVPMDNDCLHQYQLMEGHRYLC